jgi:aspartate kinase
MVVMKFGGTSVADRAAIERLIAIVRAQRQADAQQEGGDARGPIVVVSALSKVTDRLLGVAASANAGDVDGAITNLRELKLRHITVSEVITDSVQRESVVAFINREFAELERIVQALGVLREVSNRWLDTLAATGEIVSSRIIASALNAHGLLSSWIDARRAMVTDGEHQSAKPLMPETTSALMAHVDPPLASGHIPVLGGYVGANRDGVTTTLGRGGSDYSAAIVGACLGAAEIQIWTDVDGMLTADPRIVADPPVVPHLSFAEASELAYFGAKVLHPATIQPAVSRNIPVRILNSHRAHARGTLITSSRPAGGHPLTAIASKTKVSVVNISSTRMLMAHGFMRRLFEVFERDKTAVDVITTSEVTVSVTVDDRRRLPSIIEALSEFAEVDQEEDMAIVCVVGEGLQTDPALIGRVLQAAGDVRIRMVSQAASSRNVTFVIREAELAKALERLHSTFFAPEPAPAGRM